MNQGGHSKIDIIIITMTTSFLIMYGVGFVYFKISSDTNNQQDPTMTTQNEQQKSTVEPTTENPSASPQTQPKQDSQQQIAIPKNTSNQEEDDD